jgi:phosphoribosyl 1,2-cyclic phosphodiesterase
LKLRFWGVRGSFAMSGKEFLRYGGNTTCVELLTAAGQRLVIDLGTGATELAKQLMAKEFGRGKGELQVLLSHTHLDHIQGLPFFTPFFLEGNQIHIHGADPAGTSLERTIQNQLAPYYSPLEGIENLSAEVNIQSFQPGAKLQLGVFKVSTAAVPHATMWTTAFRIEAEGKVVTFLSDVEYPDPVAPDPAAVALALGADLLIHDAMHADEEYGMRRGWGHSPVSAGITVAEAAMVKKLALTHHSPDATDDTIDGMIERAQASTKVPLFGAAEGSYLDV